MTAGEGLRRAVGRLIVGKIPGTTLDDQSKQLLQSGTMGGVTFFKDNAKNLNQLNDLVFDIIESFAQGSDTIPFITVDQEGGAVQRFDHVITPLPSAMALSACANKSLLAELTKISAQELKLLGFNCLLTPVLDLAINDKNPIVSTRAYGDNEDIVASMGATVIETLSNQSILAAGKHFPGHGGTTEDTHLSLAVNDKTIEHLKTELHPFIKNLSKLPAMLTSHVWFNQIDQEPRPASLSKNITTKLLRQELKFDRLIITDDLLMKAITNKWGLGEAAVMAIEAGADVLLACGTAAEIISVHEAVVRAVETGRLSEERLEQSLARLERAFLPLSKERYLQVRAGKRQDSLKKIEASLCRNRQVSLEASMQAICQLRGAIPDLKEGNWTIVTPEHPRYPLDLQNALRQVCPETAAGVKQIRYSLNPDIAECEALKNKITEDCILITFRAAIFPGQHHLAQTLKGSCKKMLAVAADAPFDANYVSWPNYIATFDPSNLAIEALAHILKSKQTTGKNPTSMNVLVT